MLLMAALFEYWQISTGNREGLMAIVFVSVELFNFDVLLTVGANGY